MLYRLARACFRARGKVLVAWALIFVLLGVLTATARGTFDDEFRIPGASSQKALDQLRMTFPEAADASALMVVIAPPGRTIEDAGVRSAIEAELRRIDDLDFVKGTQSPYSEYVDGLISKDKSAAQIRVRVGGTAGEFSDANRQELNREGARLQRALPGSEVHLGGEVYAVNIPHVTPIEALGVVVALFVLFFTLGSVRGALLPVMSALAGAGLSIMLIFIAAGVTQINSTTMMLALMLALAVGIDYSLFILSRHRDQLATGMAAEESAARATATAGSAVIFAGCTVIIALCGLSVAGIPFLSIMGIFAAIAVAIEVLLALTLLPAMLGFLGDKLRPKPAKAKRRKKARRTASRGGIFGWWVRVVTSRPIVTALIVVIGLGSLAIPAKDLRMALPDSGQSPPTAQDRVTFDLVSERFGVGYNGPLVITGQIVESTDPLSITRGLKKDIEAMDGVQLVAVAAPNRNADTAMVQVIPTTAPDDPATKDLVERLRARAPEWRDRYGVDTAVTGFTAVAIDVSDQLGAALLPFGIFVVGLSLVLLTIVFRSIAVPIKAALGYLLSVGGAFGATQLVFNRGIGKEIINLPEAVPIISFLPIVLMGILFGLAMDYEVFLTSRMREEFVHGNRDGWIEAGFVHTAKVVTAAAIIMFAVFAFFVPAGEGAIKPIAFGLAIGVAIDAFLVRMTLGPAMMKLLGNRAWYLPPWLDKRLPVLDVEGEALAHQLSLADWPEAGSTATVHAEGLAASDDEVTLLAGVDLHVEPGETVVVTGHSASREALLLALSGRLRLSAGECKVLGRVLPEEAGQVRTATTLVDAAEPASLVGLRAPKGLVLVHGADQLEGEDRERLADLVTNPEGRSVVLSAPTAVGPHGRRRLGSDAPRRPRDRPVATPRRHRNSIRRAPSARRDSREGSVMTSLDLRRWPWRRLLALLLAPLLVAGTLLATTWNYNSRSHKVEAAVVNLDKAVQLNGRTVPLGRQLSAALVDSGRQQNFTWVLADEANAGDGLATGRYAAAVIIPEDFSAAATSYAKKDASGARQATVQVRTSPVTGVADTALGQSVADAAAVAFNDELTRSYLENVYLGFNEQAQQLVSVADGARQLADGSAKLSDGVSQAAQGSGRLADGLDAAATGGEQLSANSGKLTSGAQQLADGLGQMKAKTQGMPVQIGKLADGADQVAGGTRQLADGAGKLKAGAAQFSSGATTWADGADKFGAGARTYSDGVGQYVGGVKQLAGGADQLEKGVATYTGGVSQYVGGVNQLLDPVISLVSGLPDLSALMPQLRQFAQDLPQTATRINDAVQRLAPQLKELVRRIGQVQAGATTLDAEASAHVASVRRLAGGTGIACPESLKSVEGGCAAFAQGVKAAGSKALDDAKAVASRAEAVRRQSDQLDLTADDMIALIDQVQKASADFAKNATAYRAQILRFTDNTDLPANQGQLVSQLRQLRDGGTRLAQGGAQLRDGATKLSDGADRLAANGDRLTSGADQLATGASALSVGARKLASGAGQLTGGIDGLAAGASKLADGSGQVAGGVRQLADGLPALTDGVGRLADGAGQLSSGLGAYTGGVDQLATGVRSASTGADKLADGLGDAAGGASQLAKGTDKLADGLASGAKQVPTYTKAERENLAKVVSEPLARSSLDSLVTPQLALASLLLLLALWIGAGASAVTLGRSRRELAYSSDSTGRLLARSLVPAVAVTTAQALLLAVVGQVALRYSFAQIVPLTLLLVLAGVVFTLVNHALVAWFGRGGLLVSLAMLLVTLATTLTYAAPGVLDGLRALSPLTPAVTAFRQLVTGLPAALSMLGLVGWGLVSALAGYAALARSRTVSLGRVAAKNAV
ncbi:YhgE/Pip family protein [Nigerium massiliense]|uniref:YhgE/Pip family protein n=1 Tax=Nigerium massiliense TaxID=1522317 RepID=UPI000A3EF7E8|nr:YhgE/Pip family protein [Nigerium massiliense]